MRLLGFQGANPLVPMPGQRSILEGAPPLADLIFRALPRTFANPVLGAALQTMRALHPGIFERFNDLGETSFLIDPVDLPIAFMLRPTGRAPVLQLVRPQRALPETDAVIRGPIAALIDLLEGRIDGDAMFFNRELSISGDTAAVVTLRNAVDSDDVDLIGDLASILGPFADLFAAPARTLLRRAGMVSA